MKNEWKNYVKEAKARLNENYYNMLNDEDAVYCLNGKRLTHQQIINFNHTVSEVAASEAYAGKALGKLAEEQVYENLNNTQRVKYIFELSGIYLSLKEKINK